MRVIFVGNSNSGKTTLFNAITNSSQKTGNWHGVTVTDKSVTRRIDGTYIEFVDLAGIQSFKPLTLEESRSYNYLQKQTYDVIVNVIEANNLNQSLKLTELLKTLNKPIIVFVNFFGELIKKGGLLNAELLQKELGAQVVVGDAINKRDVKKLLQTLLSANFSSLNASFSITENVFRQAKQSLTTTDKWLLSPFKCIPLYLLSLAVVFYLAFGRFGVGSALSFIAETLLDKTSGWVDNFLMSVGTNDFVRGVFVFGVLKGVSSVLLFIPQVLVLQFALILLEQSGIIARLSFVMDNVLQKFGLNGRSVFMLIMGLGCTAISAELSNGLETVNAKKHATSAVGYLSCSARLPVFLFFASAVSKTYSFAFVAFAYLVSVVTTLCVLFVKCKIGKSIAPPLLIEIPPLRAPKLQPCINQLKNSTFSFVQKILCVVLLTSVTVYVFMSVTPSLQFVQGTDINKSILAVLGGKLAFVFAPINLFDWRISTAFLSGVFAKESIVSTLFLLYDGGLKINIAQSLALVAFTATYTPCIVALYSQKRQLGFKNMLKVESIQLAISLAICYTTYIIVKFLVGV